MFIARTTRKLWSVNGDIDADTTVYVDRNGYDYVIGTRWSDKAHNHEGIVITTNDSTAIEHK